MNGPARLAILFNEHRQLMNKPEKKERKNRKKVKTLIEVYTEQREATGSLLLANGHGLPKKMPDRVCLQHLQGTLQREKKRNKEKKGGKEVP